MEKLCNFSENVGYSQDLVAVMSELNLALKDLGQTFKTYNKERAKSGAHVAVPMPIGVTPSSSHSGNVQILVNELKGLVQDGDPLDKYNLLKKVGEGYAYFLSVFVLILLLVLPEAFGKRKRRLILLTQSP